LNESEISLVDCDTLALTSDYANREKMVKEIERLLHHNKQNEIGHVPRKKIDEQIERNNYTFACYESEIVAFSEVYKRNDGILKFYRLMVHGKYRRNGIGRMLVRNVDLIAAWNHKTPIFACVRQDNHPIIELLKGEEYIIAHDYPKDLFRRKIAPIYVVMKKGLYIPGW
jgi:ribosomal protein S18 acetylase RimI-like enzyme